MRFLLGVFGSIAAFGLIEILMMRWFNREIWDTYWGKAISIGWPVATLLVAALRFFSLGEDTPRWVVQVLMELAAFLLVGLIASTLALLIVGLFKGVLWGIEKVKSETSTPKVELDSRRKFLKIGVSALPALAAAGSGLGVVGSLNGVRTFDLPMTFKNLPAELEGFRILHLSDLHLGPFLNLSDLEKLAEEVSTKPFDLVTIIGDIADDLDLLADALKIVKAIPSRYGHFATLGNHEYYRGIRRVQRTFDAGPIPLLVNGGLSLTDKNLPNGKMFLGGADDPVSMGWKADREVFYQNAVSESFAGSSDESFKLLLTHRPGSFDKAADAGIDLSLAGHTHGGQLGLLGRSMLDFAGDDLYLWGKYNKGESQLYTSSGVGHWFPFRLGCPAEAPTIILRRG